MIADERDFLRTGNQTARADIIGQTGMRGTFAELSMPDESSQSEPLTLTDTTTALQRLLSEPRADKKAVTVLDSMDDVEKIMTEVAMTRSADIAAFSLYAKEGSTRTFSTQAVVDSTVLAQDPVTHKIAAYYPACHDLTLRRDPSRRPFGFESVGLSASPRNHNEPDAEMFPTMQDLRDNLKFTPYFTEATRLEKAVLLTFCDPAYEGAPCSFDVMSDQISIPMTTSYQGHVSSAIVIGSRPNRQSLGEDVTITYQEGRERIDLANRPTLMNNLLNGMPENEQNLINGVLAYAREQAGMGGPVMTVEAESELASRQPPMPLQDTSPRQQPQAGFRMDFL